MTIIKIAPNENGSHDNQTISGVTLETFPLPEGYAIIPEEVGTPETLENYPFGEITVETKYRYSTTIDGEEKAVVLDEKTDPKGMKEEIINTVTSWTPLPVPEPEPEPEPEPSQLDRVEAQVTYTAMMTDTLLEG